MVKMIVYEKKSGPKFEIKGWMEEDVFCCFNKWGHTVYLRTWADAMNCKYSSENGYDYYNNPGEIPEEDWDVVEDWQVASLCGGFRQIVDDYF